MFTKATRTQRKLRLAIMGLSGGGKTMTALRMATGIIGVTGGQIGMIDSESGSAAIYADRFDFDLCDLKDRTIPGYLAAIGEATKAGMQVLIIDSLSHAWAELLEEIDQLAKRKYKGSTWSAWSEGTPKQKKLVQALLAFPGHLIVTMRVDTAWETTKDERSGKTMPVKLGLKPSQGKGIEYEFDMLMEITREHQASVEKDRTGKYQDKVIDKPGEEFGKALIESLLTGAPAAVADKQPAHVKELLDLFRELGINDVAVAATEGWVRKTYKVQGYDDLTAEQAADVATKIKAKIVKKAAAV